MNCYEIALAAASDLLMGKRDNCLKILLTVLADVIVIYILANKELANAVVDENS